MKKALIIIDLQNDFLPGGSLAVPNSDEIIPLINNIQKEFDVVVTTQDWHPLTHKSFALNHISKKPFDLIQYRGYKQVLWPNHCVAQSRGAALSKLLHMEKVQMILRKGMNPQIDSYSAFSDNEKAFHTGLEAYLRSMNVTKVFLCGLAADYCVYYSALDAKALNFETYYLSQATRYISYERYIRVLEDMKEKSIHIL